ncbi:CrcB family protein [Arcanobacterium sp. S3PF19]|uniref:fluoride efflux transporter FluC n=1 Tax=Arcanobacterium sp. S3PF19 TaxID=1219585 RepID=UPI0006924AF8|nr:CrcB family protein [Arcanobacterium sp. S3PF19]
MIRKLFCVFFGSAAGVLCRYALTLLCTGISVIFAVNTAGSFLLGFACARLDSALSSGRHALPVSRLQNFRLFCCTGFLGGFTTYSTFVLDAYRLHLQAENARALLYAAFSLAAGVLAALCGIAAGRRAARRGKECHALH